MDKILTDVEESRSWRAAADTGYFRRFTHKCGVHWGTCFMVIE